MKIVVVGVGYVGLVTGTCLAEVGFEVVCVDSDAAKINRLQKGQNPIYEPGLEPMIHKNIAGDRLFFTTNLPDALQGASAVFIAVGTPEKDDGTADLKYVNAVSKELGQTLNSEMIVIVKSTVPVGTCDLVAASITKELKNRGKNLCISVASNPEFLQEGRAVKNFMRPDRIVVGIEDKRDRAFFVSLYKPFILDDEGKLLFMDRRSSELAKYGANAMLACRISFMNELAILCEKVGANIDHIRLGIGSDDRIGRKFLYAGPGYGGSCFPKDVAALLKIGAQYETKLGVLEGVDQANKRQGQFIFDKIKRIFPNLRNRRFAVWGLSFKPGTDDIRDTPSLGLIRSLIDSGADVVAHDPEGQANFARAFGDDPGLTYRLEPYDTLNQVDGLILITEWNEYRVPDWKKVKSLMRSRVIFDFRNQYDVADMVQHQFTYECIGRPGCNFKTYEALPGKAKTN